MFSPNVAQWCCTANGELHRKRCVALQTLHWKKLRPKRFKPKNILEPFRSYIFKLNVYFAELHSDVAPQALCCTATFTLLKNRNDVYVHYMKEHDVPFSRKTFRSINVWLENVSRFVWYVCGATCTFAVLNRTRSTENVATIFCVRDVYVRDIREQEGSALPDTYALQKHYKNDLLGYSLFRCLLSTTVQRSFAEENKWWIRLHMKQILNLNFRIWMRFEGSRRLRALNFH